MKDKAAGTVNVPLVIIVYTIGCILFIYLLAAPHLRAKEPEKEE